MIKNLRFAGIEKELVSFYIKELYVQKHVMLGFPYHYKPAKENLSFPLQKNCMQIFSTMERFSVPIFPV